MEYVINVEVTSMRQAAEWGMGLFQSSFLRVNGRLRFHYLGERKLIFRMYFLLFNYHTTIYSHRFHLEIRLCSIKRPDLSRCGWS